MKLWNQIVEEQIAKGMSRELATNYANNKVKELRQAFNPYTVNGTSLDKAKKLLEENGYSVRVLGSYMNLDWRPSRVNLKVNEETNTVIVESLG